MIATVVLELFSGMPNPEWSVGEDVARDILAALEKFPLERPGYHPIQDYDDPLGRPRSGYRGISIDFEEDKKHMVFEIFGDLVLDVRSGRVRRDTQKAIEKRMFETVPKVLVAEVLEGMSYEQVIDPGHEAAIEGLKTVPRKLKCARVLSYRGRASTFQQFRLTNNCYNYATNVVNKVPTRQAIPGTPNMRRPLTMAKLRAAIEDDKLEPLGMELPDACPAVGSHYVAVLLRTSPNGSVRDFHCMRLDRTGAWSHKDGSGDVRNVDDNGTKIVDLSTAALSWNPVLAGFYLFRKSERGRIS